MDKKQDRGDSRMLSPRSESEAFVKNRAAADRRKAVQLLLDNFRQLISDF